ncbi:LOW QUALITY PROTEIN: hypothetical protein TorRG33x02_251630 [Trema orientale]|uniref:Transmembrane protein n=1 Tax=Trema orientale TaxID=63057 RepID=A0A2P5DH48_TREOI|nr:LOW QUALITY PROTEIN: hypothetical protein TorRG33x02_251630 [Trema orientale]
MEEEQESEAKEITPSRKQPSRELGLRVTRNGFWRRRRRKRASERVRDVEGYQQNRHYQNCLTVSSSSSSSSSFSKKSKNQSSIKLFLSSTLYVFIFIFISIKKKGKASEFLK